MHALTKSAIDRAGRRYRNYEEVPNDRRLLQAYRGMRCQAFDSDFETLAGCLRDLPCAVGCRVKQTDTVVRKLRRESTMALSRMDDIVAFRVVVPSPAVQQTVAERLERCPRTSRIADYASNPGGHEGYRAIHVIVRQNVRYPSGTTHGHTCEIQVRTHYQHVWATVSESFGQQVKEGGGSAEVREYLRELSEKIEAYEETHPTQCQQDGLAVKGEVAFVVVVFDKRSGLAAMNEDFGTNLEDAIARLLYLEESYGADFSKETVLLGVVSEDREPRVTHMRYYLRNGVPEVDACIQPARARP